METNNTTEPRREGLIHDPAFRRMMRHFLIFFAIMLGVLSVSSAINFYRNVWPLRERLNAMRAEADVFRARNAADVEAQVAADVGWPEVLGGKAAGKIVRLTGKVGSSHQVIKGAVGGTLFLFPADAPDTINGDRVLVYFEETEPPARDTRVEILALVGEMNPMDAAVQIQAERARELASTIPRAILFARPLKILELPPGTPAP